MPLGGECKVAAHDGEPVATPDPRLHGTPGESMRARSASEQPPRKLDASAQRERAIARGQPLETDER